MSPQPIDRDRLTIARKGGNGSRRRRFALDRAKAHHYATARSERFQGRLTSR